MPASSFQQQKLRVCEVCSAYLGLHDNDRRLADHFGGKLHLGFIEIREKLEELRVIILPFFCVCSYLIICQAALEYYRQPWNISFCVCEFFSYLLKLGFHEPKKTKHCNLASITWIDF